MTPAEAADHNRTAPHAAQARACPSCGRYHATPGWAGWRRSPAGVDYARKGYCSEQCLNVDDPDSTIDTARLYDICQHLATQASYAGNVAALLCDMRDKIDAGYTLSGIERRTLSAIAMFLQDGRP